MQKGIFMNKKSKKSTISLLVVFVTVMSIYIIWAIGMMHPEPPIKIITGVLIVLSIIMIVATVIFADS